MPQPDANLLFTSQILIKIFLRTRFFLVGFSVFRLWIWIAVCERVCVCLFARGKGIKETVGSTYWLNTFCLFSTHFCVLSFSLGSRCFCDEPEAKTMKSKFAKHSWFSEWILFIHFIWRSKNPKIFTCEWKSGALALDTNRRLYFFLFRHSVQRRRWRDDNNEFESEWTGDVCASLYTEYTCTHSAPVVARM